MFCSLFVLFAVGVAKPRLLTPYLENGEHHLAREISAVQIAGVDYGYSGYFTVPSQNKPGVQNHIFFWYQPCLLGCADDTTPLLLWLQGGPGGAGVFGAMTEIGNWYVDKTINPQLRCNSWCLTRNCLYVDQPVEAGFSYQTGADGRPITTLDNLDWTDNSPSAMRQIHLLLNQFLDVFPELRPAPFVITGESYGGLYTPNLGYLLLNDSSINFKGLAIGDPIIDSKAQWPTYPDTLYGMGVVMQDERDQLRAILQRGVDKLKAFESGKGSCQAAFDEWNSIWDDDGHDSGVSTQGLFTTMTGSTMTEDVLMTESPPEFDYYSEWFARPEVAQAFGISGYLDNKPKDPKLGLTLYDAFVLSGDICRNSSYLYSQLLGSGKIDLMIYSSTADPLLGPPTTETGINSILSERWTPRALAAAYYSANKTLWTAGGSKKTAGYARCAPIPGTARRFCYTVVRNAGHMTPTFVPAASLEMLERFLGGISFGPDGDGKVSLPNCAACGGAGPFAGPALPECVCGHS